MIGCGGPSDIKPTRLSLSCSDEVEMFREAELEFDDSSEEGSLYYRRRQAYADGRMDGCCLGVG